VCAAEPVETPYGAVSLDFELRQVPDRPVYYVVGRSGVPDAENEGHTSNAAFVVTDEGVVVFDALGTPALGYRLLQRIREVTDQPVVRVVVSHYHADHVYGLQAFAEHGGAPEVWAQWNALDYVGGSDASPSEGAQRRLVQRREALFPWVDEETFIVVPDVVFEKAVRFELGGVDFEVRHMGPAHAPGDATMIVEDHGVVFSGDVIFDGRVPFLDSPETDIEQWLRGLDYIAGLQGRVSFIIPGHGEPSDDPQEAVAFTRGYISDLKDVMSAAVEDFIPFEQAYRQADWSEYADLPAFDGTHRGNAYRVYLEQEARSLQ
jgi:glyoxylase-like metal-dependent hydrolase (beta-lactamase superfamily II)